MRKEERHADWLSVTLGDQRLEQSMIAEAVAPDTLYGRLDRGTWFILELGQTNDEIKDGLRVVGRGLAGSDIGHSELDYWPVKTGGRFSMKDA